MQSRLADWHGTTIFGSTAAATAPLVPQVGIIKIQFALLPGEEQLLGLINLRIIIGPALLLCMSHVTNSACIGCFGGRGRSVLAALNRQSLCESIPAGLLASPSCELWLFCLLPCQCTLEGQPSSDGLMMFAGPRKNPRGH